MQLGERRFTDGSTRTVYRSHDGRQHVLNDEGEASSPGEIRNAKGHKSACGLPWSARRDGGALAGPPRSGAMDGVRRLRDAGPLRRWHSCRRSLWRALRSTAWGQVGTSWELGARPRGYCGCDLHWDCPGCPCPHCRGGSSLPVGAIASDQADVDHFGSIEVISWRCRQNRTCGGPLVSHTVCEDGGGESSVRFVWALPWIVAGAMAGWFLPSVLIPRPHEFEFLAIVGWRILLIPTGAIIGLIIGLRSVRPRSGKHEDNPAGEADS